MSLHYPEIYKEYNVCVGERKKNERIEQQKKLDALVNDKEKLAELRQEALKAVADYNKEMNSSLRFKSFYDHHTQLVLVPMNKYMKLKPEYTRPVPYPVSCFPGQYTTYYRKFSPDELRELPVQTVLENEQIFPAMKRAMSPPNVLVSEQELQRKIDEEKLREKKMNSTTEQNQSTPARITAALNARRQSNVSAICSICNTGVDAEKVLMLQCNSCLSHTHQLCLDMPQRMYQVVKTYQWTCIDCKRCTVCMKPDNEDAMMCCDNCDRGYHTFCVGMNEPPTGTWICSRFCSKVPTIV
uniref:PHD-type domain-containing protein n=1 Tax=Panagrolaimus sp. JU765 TaxID=591449 RepID=A0AC34PYA9_9BILA